MFGIYCLCDDIIIFVYRFSAAVVDSGRRQCGQSDNLADSLFMSDCCKCQLSLLLHSSYREKINDFGISSESETKRSPIKWPFSRYVYTLCHGFVCVEYALCTIICSKMVFQWRKFNFFDLKKDVDDGKLATVLKVSVLYSIL